MLKGVEGEHGLIHPNQLHIPESGDLDGVIHVSKEVVVLLIGKVDHILSVVDELKLNSQV